MAPIRGGGFVCAAASLQMFILQFYVKPWRVKCMRTAAKNI